MRGVPFFIDERAIVPRSYIGEILDDELFETLIDPGKVKSVLDLCTGSGCLAILAAMRFPKAKVDAADLSKDALAVAKKNVALHRMQRRVRLAQGDLFAPLAGKRYDLIVSNPPYVDAKGHARPAAGMPARAGACVRRRQGRHRDRAADHRRGGPTISRRAADCCARSAAAGRHWSALIRGCVFSGSTPRRAAARCSGWMQRSCADAPYAAACLPLGCTSAV